MNSQITARLVLTAAATLTLQMSALGQTIISQGGMLNHDPKISGNYVSWIGVDDDNSYSGAFRGIYLYDGSATRQIAGPVDGMNQPSTIACMDGDKVAWYQGKTHWYEYELFYYNGSTTSQLTNNDACDAWPQVSGNSVVWMAVPSVGRPYVNLYDGTSVRQLTSTEGSDPDIDGGKIVWEDSSSTWGHLVLYDGTTLTTLPGSQKGLNPRISGNNVFWYTYDWNTRYIKHFDGTTTTVIGTYQTPDSGLGSWAPVTTPVNACGDTTGWIGYDGQDSEVFYFDGTRAIQLTDDDLRDSDLAISDQGAVWLSSDDIGNHLYAFDLASGAIVKIADDIRGVPDISGNKVVWGDYSGNIWMATIPEPTTISLLAIGGMAMLRRRK